LSTNVLRLKSCDQIRVSNFARYIDCWKYFPTWTKMYLWYISSCHYTEGIILYCGCGWEVYDAAVHQLCEFKGCQRTTKHSLTQKSNSSTAELHFHIFSRVWGERCFVSFCYIGGILFHHWLNCCQKHALSGIFPIFSKGRTKIL
jgi:hypothetical protein